MAPSFARGIPPSPTTARGSPARLINQSTLGSCDSSASLDRFDTESLAADMDAWRLSRSRSDPEEHEPLAQFSPTEPCLIQDPLTDMSHAMHAVASVLKAASLRESRAVEEALQWKHRYEAEREQREVLEKAGTLSHGLRNGVQKETPPSRPVRTRSSEKDDSGESSNGDTPSCHMAICDKGVLRSSIARSPDYSSDGLRGEETVVGTCEESQLAVGRDTNSCSASAPGRCPFRLAWRVRAGEGTRRQRHRHDVVSYESGHICSNVRHSKQIMLLWEDPPKSALIVRKPHSSAVDAVVADVIRLLVVEKEMQLFVEPEAYKELTQHGYGQLHTWKADEEFANLSDRVDCVITLGGDGTVLWAASLFKGPVPPLMSFAMGSLGFMTPFEVKRHRELLEKFFEGPVYLTLRNRLQCRIVRGVGEEEPGDLRGFPASEDKLVLNEVAIDRGMSSFLTNLDCYCDGLFMTSVQGDGLIVSTPSGSTAYSLAAGGSMVHPQVPAILFTPICPHSLSFRPLILPEYVTLRIQIPKNSRGQAWVSFDGKDRQQLSTGDSLLIGMSSYPVPAACPQDATSDFLRSVQEGLHWNMRKQQG